jgi:hypothetical protein
VAVEQSNKSVPQVVSELWELTKDYARQETVDPLKGVARYVGAGMAGVFIGGLGVIMLLLAMLRALQLMTDPGDPLSGSLTWVPYLLVLIVAVALVAVAIARISRK